MSDSASESRLAADRVRAEPLVPLPAQPEGLPWPTQQWPTGEPSAALSALLDRAFDDSGPLAETFAAVVVHRGRLVAERYAGQLEHFDRPAEPIDVDTPLLSWSMAKSMLHATVGLLVGDGLLTLDEPAPVPQWTGDDRPPGESRSGDVRSAITLQTMLEMRDGLDFVEDYVDDRASDVIEMLFGSGQGDTARFAADRPSAAPPGERFSYSSGTSNIISGVVARALGGEEGYRRYLHERLFDPIGMTSAAPTFDAAGTWVASSYLHATARDFARFGYLYLRDGVWDGRRLLPERWVEHGRLPRSVDLEGLLYGAHWWVAGDRYGSFRAAGYEGQYIVVCPALDLVVVRLGKTPAERGPLVRSWLADVVDSFGGGSVA